MGSICSTHTARRKGKHNPTPVNTSLSTKRASGSLCGSSSADKPGGSRGMDTPTTPTADTKTPTKNVDTAEIPETLLPASLRSLPKEMQNMMMGRWPVPPTPSEKCLRIAIIGDELSCRLERTLIVLHVLPKLRAYAEEMDFHLQVMDTNSLLPGSFQPTAYQRMCDTRAALEENIAIWIIFLDNKVGWHLPSFIPVEDFEEIKRKMDLDLAACLLETYRLDSNYIPPCYYLCPAPSHEEAITQQRSELFTWLCHNLSPAKQDTYLNEGFPEGVDTALKNYAGIVSNILVVRRQIYNLPEVQTHTAHKAFFDVDHEGIPIHWLAEKRRIIVQNVERKVSAESFLNINVSWDEMETSLLGQETPYTKNITNKLDEMLRGVVERMAEKNVKMDPYLTAGLPTLLSQELLLHANKEHTTLCSSQVPPPGLQLLVKELKHSPSRPHRPVLMTGDVGCGMHTLASHLAHVLTQRHPGCLMALRYMALSPESQTATGALFIILEQVTTIFGGNRQFGLLKSVQPADILKRISASLGKAPLTIILCCIDYMMVNMEDMAWMTDLLPTNIELVILTTCSKLCARIKAKQVPQMEKEQVESLFLDRLKAKNRTLNPSQLKSALSVVGKARNPSYAVLMAALAMEWRSDTEISRKHLPLTLVELYCELIKQAVAVVGPMCTYRILCYLAISKFGLSDTEMEDVLTIDDDVILNLYPNTLLKIRRFPPSIWLYLKHKLAPLLTVTCVYGYRVFQWRREIPTGAVLDMMDAQSQSLHLILEEYYRGEWADKPKPLANRGKQMATALIPTSVIAQPNSYGKEPNCRKFLCIMHHMLHHADLQKRELSVRQHLLNLDWLVTKLNATSLVQLIDCLRAAKYATPALEPELVSLQLMLARNACALNVNGAQLYSRMYSCLETERLGQSQANDQLSSDSVDLNGPRIPTSLPDSKAQAFPFLTSQSCFEAQVKNAAFPFLTYSYGGDPEELNGYSAPSKKYLSNQMDADSKPQSCPNGFFSFGATGKVVVSISTEANAIMVWDTVKHVVVQKVDNVNRPHDLVFLDRQHVGVLCDRELKVYDLKAGAVTSVVRGMLNLQMPFFYARDANTMVVLSRNRMQVSVITVLTSHILATFKAGEDRFLNSMLVSANGMVLVAGDETHKPSLMLVWDLNRSKLMHDLRLPQHEFLTSMAAISNDGHFVVCGCRAVNSEEVFVVMFDLVSGQLYRQFRFRGSATALAMGSATLVIPIAINDGSLKVFDIQSGNCKFNMAGVKAVYNRMRLSSDETIAVTFNVNAGAMPVACTVSMWDIRAGTLLASYTFNDPVTCCIHAGHSNNILAGVKNCERYIILKLGKPLNSADSAGSATDHMTLWNVVSDPAL